MKYKKKKKQKKGLATLVGKKKSNGQTGRWVQAERKVCITQKPVVN